MKRILLLGLLALTMQTKSMEIAPSQRNTINTPLVQAVLNQNVDEVKVLLAAGANPNEEAPHKILGKWTPVEAAMATENCTILRELISTHPNLETRNYEGHTPLIRAAYENKIEIVQELLKGGADVNAKSQQSKKTALAYAYQKRNFNLMALLAFYDADVTVLPQELQQKLAPLGEQKLSQDIIIYTPLIEAILQQDTERVKTLLKEGANPNEPISFKNRENTFKDNKKTPLYYAYQTNNYPLIELLDAFGANYNALESQTCIEIADRLAALTDKNPSCYPIDFLLEAAQNNPSIAIRPLSHQKLPLIDITMRTPLHRMTVLHYLLREFYTKTTFEQRITFYDCSSKDLVELQIQNKFNINTIDTSGYTPLFIAVYHADHVMVKALLSAGAHEKSNDEHINSPSGLLHLNHNDELAYTLQQLYQLKKYDWNKDDLKYSEYLHILKSLLDYNEDLCHVTINFSTGENLRIIDFAVKYNLQDVVKLIKQYMKVQSLTKITSKSTISFLTQQSPEGQKHYLSTLPLEMLAYLQQEINKEITTSHYKSFNYQHDQQLKNLKSCIDQILANNILEIINPIEQ